MKESYLCGQDEHVPTAGWNDESPRDQYQQDATTHRWVDYENEGQKNADDVEAAIKPISVHNVAPLLGHSRWSGGK